MSYAYRPPYSGPARIGRATSRVSLARSPSVSRRIADADADVFDGRPVNDDEESPVSGLAATLVTLAVMSLTRTAVEVSVGGQNRRYRRAHGSSGSHFSQHVPGEPYVFRAARPVDAGGISAPAEFGEEVVDRGEPGRRLQQP